MKVANVTMKDYISKRFTSKSNFVAFIKDNSGIKLSNNKSYDSLFSEIEKNIGEDKFLSILGIKSTEEAEIRTILADAFYKALIETTWSHQLSPLYEKLIGDKLIIKRNVEKREPAYKLAFSVDESDFIKAWIDLYKEGVLPGFIHYKDITIGPLGWKKSLEERETFGITSGLFSGAVNIIFDKFDDKSRNCILNALLGTIEQIGEDPSSFEVPQEEGNKALEYLRQIHSEKDETIFLEKCLQLFHIYLNDENFSFILNQLIANGEIKPKVQGLYENYPYTFSDWIITPYGIFKQLPYSKREPSKALSDILKKEFNAEDLEFELKNYHGDYSQNILAYCIKENPEKILNQLFGMPQLRNLAKKMDIIAVKTIKNKDELIKLILLKMAFRIPPKIVGISDYKRFLDENFDNLENNQSVKEIMREVYIETEGILRELSYFYICLYGKKSTGINPEVLDELIKELNISDKPFQRLTFGEHIKLIREINKNIENDELLEKRFLTAFNRNYAVPKSQIKILDKISPFRKPFIHPEPNKEIPTVEECLQIISQLQKFSEIIDKESIYPVNIQIKREVTNEYGISYYEVSDDKGAEWWIYKHRVWLDFNKSYYMYSKTNLVAVNPIIIEKIF